MCAEYIDIFSPGGRIVFSLLTHPKNVHYTAPLGTIGTKDSGTRPSGYILPSISALLQLDPSVLRYQETLGNLIKQLLALGASGHPL